VEGAAFQTRVECLIWEVMPKDGLEIGTWAGEGRSGRGHVNRLNRREPHCENLVHLPCEFRDCLNTLESLDEC
jgi:hypothetical protein